MKNSSGAVSLTRAAGAGVLSAAAGVSVGHFVAALNRDWASPIYDVGDRVIDRVPTSLKQLAIDWFGTNDKPVLLASIVVVLAIAAAIAGIVAARRSLKLGIAITVGFGLLGVASAVYARTGTNWSRGLPAMAAIVVTALTMWSLLRTRTGAVVARSDDADPAADADAESEPVASGAWSTADFDERPSARPVSTMALDRRQVLVRSGGVALGAAAFAGAGSIIDRRTSVAGDRGDLVLPNARTPLSAIPDGARVPEAVPFFTPNADFYRIDTALSVPQVPVDDWTLRVHGMVDRELEFDFDELLDRFEVVEEDITLTCVSNLVGGELVGTARWLGVRLGDVLELAGVEPSADQIVGRSTDGYTCGFPTAALDGQRPAMIAVGMNGEPLPVEHGYPARLIVSGIYGYASATKWLTDIELNRFDEFDHYWVPRGYAAKAPIKLSSRIDTPAGLERVPPGPTPIAGVAWAQPIGIKAVEIKVDDGEWTSVDVAAEVNGSTWRQWSHVWDATPGRHTISVRGISADGAIQTDKRSEPLPDGATGHHTIVVLVDE